MFVIALAAEKFSLLRNNDAREKAIKSWKKIHGKRTIRPSLESYCILRRTPTAAERHRYDTRRSFGVALLSTTPS